MQISIYNQQHIECASAHVCILTTYLHRRCASTTYEGTTTTCMHVNQTMHTVMHTAFSQSCMHFTCTVATHDYTQKPTCMYRMTTARHTCMTHMYEHVYNRMHRSKGRAHSIHTKHTASVHGCACDGTQTTNRCGV